MRRLRGFKVLDHSSNCKLLKFFIFELVIGPVIIISMVSLSMEKAEKELPINGEVFFVKGHTAFLILPDNKISENQPWVWYAPTLPGLPGPEEKWMFERFLSEGIAIAGIDVGESYGNPEGREIFTAFYDELTQNRGLSKKACMLARSRGGLMIYNWAVEHPKSVACIAGIYPVCNLNSYPGAEIAKDAYRINKDDLAQHNPINRLQELAKEHVPIFHIHGDSDTVVPLEDNSVELTVQYSQLGGEATIVVPRGQGHNMWQGFFQCQELVNFVIAHAKNNLKNESIAILNDSIAMQWGGHTFSYLLLGKDKIFWSATAYDPNDKTPTALIGQKPLRDKIGPSITSKISFSGQNVKGNNQPQIVRSKDGYIHAFIGVTYSTDNPNFNTGHIYYYRSHKPEDITKLIDRTELIPTQPFYDFHLRMNVGISQDGQRIALVILAISEDGKVPFNTPVIFIGEKRGADFVFREPFAYAEPMSFFYPQVAVTDDGIIIIGEIWDKDNEKLRFTRLIHLDWSGKIMHREDFPVDNEGNYFSYDMRPQNDEDWSNLIIYYNKQPADRKDCRHEFWRYNTKTKQLSLIRSIETEYSSSNSGRWIPITKGYSAFINNPSLGQLNIWKGDILGGGEITRCLIPNTNPKEMGYQFSAYLFVPSVLQGSVASPDSIYIASDFVNKERESDKSGPCTFILWRLDKTNLGEK